MELWIRSQDGETIMKVNRLDIDTNGIDIMVNGFETKVGRYSKERALQVLDEIQNILQPKVVFHEPKIDYDDLIHSYSKNVVIRANQQVEYDLKNAGQIVYMMPKE